MSMNLVAFGAEIFDPAFPQWLNYLVAIYRQGLIQVAMILLSVFCTEYFEAKTRGRTYDVKRIYRPKFFVGFEATAHLMYALTFSLLMACSSKYYDQVANTALAAFTCMLNFLKLAGPDRLRQATARQIDVLVLSTFFYEVLTEVLPFMVIGGQHPVNRRMNTAMLPLFVSVCVCITTPNEWLPPPSDVNFPGDAEAEATPEETSSWLDYLGTFSRAGSLMFKRRRTDITMDKLNKLPWKHNPELMRRRLSKLRKTQPSITRALLALLWPQLLSCAALGVLLSASKLLAPVGVYYMLEYMRDRPNARFYPGLWLIVIVTGRILQVIFGQACASESRRLTTQVKAMMTAEVYRSAMASRQLQGNFMKDPHVDNSRGPQSTAAGIVENLISTDTNGIIGLNNVLMAVTALPAAGAAVFALYQMVGWPCLAGIALALCGAPLQTWVKHYVADHEKKLKKARDVRMSLVSEYLRSINLVKYFGWEEPVVKNISKARAEEQKHIWAIDMFSTGVKMIADFFPILSLLLVFYLHVGVHQAPLSAATAYTTVHLLEQVRMCLALLALASVDYSRAIISLRRFDKYFKSLTPLDVYPTGPVTIRAATFQRAVGASFYLRDITIRFTQGGLNVVTGLSGSGKSTLLLALLGEAVMEGGIVTRPEEVAFASQSPWLLSGTIRENIIFNNEEHDRRYNRVVQACCLDADFDEMPDGDETKIGEGAWALSGGQRARVALARALFSSASLLLLDDIFSSLDTKTAAELWNGVFCSDLIRDRTVILVTQLRWVVHEANTVVTMGNGRVESVIDKIGHKRKQKHVESSYKTPIRDNRVSKPSKGTGKRNGKQSADSESKENMTDKKASTSSIASRVAVLHFLLYFGGASIAALTVSICFFHTGADLYTHYWISSWVANAAKDENSVVLYLLAYIGLSYVTVAIDGLRMLAFARGIWIAAKQLHEETVRSVMSSPLSWFTEDTISGTMNRLFGDISTLDQSIHNSIVPVISGVVNCLLMIGAITFELPSFMTRTLGLTVVGGLVAWLYERANSVLKQLVVDSQSPVISEFSEGMSGLAIIRASPKVPGFFHTKLNKLLRASIQTSHAQMEASLWLKFRMGALAVLVNGYAVYLVLEERGRMSPGLAGFCLTQASLLSDRIVSLISGFNSLSLDMQTFHRVREYCQLPPEDSVPNKEGQESGLPETWPQTGAIELKHVAVRYDLEGQDVLRNVSLKFERGQRVAVVGKTGSGKSTLILTLLGFTNISAGQVLYDGVDLTTIPRQRLRHSISTVPQEAQLFQGTIASNLDPSGTLPEAELQRALDVCQSILAEAQADSSESSDGDDTSDTSASSDGTPSETFTERLTLSTVVEENGGNFSHGQRQVLSLCRSLVRRSKLVLLDEATSSMDVSTDTAVQRALREELTSGEGRNRTVVTVAHRLQTIIDYDQVVVMNAGKVQEAGSPKDLLEKRGGFYDMVRHSGEGEELVEAILEL